MGLGIYHRFKSNRKVLELEQQNKMRNVEHFQLIQQKTKVIKQKAKKALRKLMVPVLSSEIKQSKKFKM